MSVQVELGRDELGLDGDLSQSDALLESAVRELQDDAGGPRPMSGPTLIDRDDLSVQRDRFLWNHALARWAGVVLLVGLLGGVPDALPREVGLQDHLDLHPGPVRLADPDVLVAVPPVEADEVLLGGDGQELAPAKPGGFGVDDVAEVHVSFFPFEDGGALEKNFGGRWRPSRTFHLPPSPHSQVECST